MTSESDEQYEIGYDTATGQLDKRLLEHVLAMDQRDFAQFGRFVDTICETWNEACDIRNGDIKGGN